MEKEKEYLTWLRESCLNAPLGSMITVLGSRSDPFGGVMLTTYLEGDGRDVSGNTELSSVRLSSPELEEFVKNLLRYIPKHRHGWLMERE